MSHLDVPVFGRGVEREEDADVFYRRMMLKLKDCGVELPPNARLLEVGSGSGTVLNFLKGKGFNIEGVDIKPRSAEVIKADIAALPYEDESFDCVISKQVFDNVVYPMQSPAVQKAMLREIGRALKKGGIFYAVGEVLDEPLEGLRRLHDPSGDYFISVYIKL